MALPSDLVSQFSKVMNDSGIDKASNTLRGTITKRDESLYVQLDGSGELTPISRTVEVNDGDRVEVSIANHAATVTGNLTSPSIGVATEGNLRSEIAQSAGFITLTVKDENGNFTTYKQDISAFYFVDNDGTVKIDGGSIDAKNLNLTGHISFDDLDSASSAQLKDIASDASDAADSASEASSIAKSIAKGTYSGSTSTFIDKKTVRSPTIIGGQYYATSEGTYLEMTSTGFKVYDADIDEPKLTMKYSDSSNTIELILGAGNDSGYNRFYVKKTDTGAKMYLVGSTGTKCGFIFNAGGSIGIVGETYTASEDDL